MLPIGSGEGLANLPRPIKSLATSPLKDVVICVNWPNKRPANQLENVDVLLIPRPAANDKDSLS